MRPVPPTPSSAATARCLDRAHRAASAGDRLEAAYWQSAADAAQRRITALPAPRPSGLAWLLRGIISAASRQERVA